MIRRELYNMKILEYHRRLHEYYSADDTDPGQLIVLLLSHGWSTMMRDGVHRQPKTKSIRNKYIFITCIAVEQTFAVGKYSPTHTHTHGLPLHTFAKAYAIHRVTKSICPKNRGN